MTQVTDQPTIRNGLNVDQIYGTLNAVKGEPSLGRFQFRAQNTWINGTHNRSTIKGFYGAGQEDATRTKSFTLDADEPALLLGRDIGPNPAEFLLHALAACLTTTMVNVAAARGVHLTHVESTIEGNLDVNGALGLNDEVRNGFEDIRITFRVQGDAPEEKLREVVSRARSRSVVFDSISRGVPVDVVYAS